MPKPSCSVQAESKISKKVTTGLGLVVAKPISPHMDHHLALNALVWISQLSFSFTVISAVRDLTTVSWLNPLESRHFVLIRHPTPFKSHFQNGWVYIFYVSTLCVLGLFHVSVWLNWGTTVLCSLGRRRFSSGAWTTRRIHWRTCCAGRKLHCISGFLGAFLMRETEEIAELWNHSSDCYKAGLKCHFSFCKSLGPD